MTRQLPKPVAVPLGLVIFGAINAAIYSGGWLCMRWDDLTDAIESRRTARALWREADQYLRDGAK
ncbi:hypothetical protein [Mycolicibacterium sp. XJ775]